MPPTLYGVPYGADALANLEVGRSAGRLVSIRRRCPHSGVLNATRIYLKNDGTAGPGGYWDGTGGSIKCDICPDDGSGLPVTGTILATRTITTPGGGSALGSFVFASPPTLTAGVIYHRVFTNADASPTVNYVSIDDLYLAPGTSPMQPGVADLDMAILWRASGSGAPVVNLGHGPIFDDLFADGFHDGLAFYDALSGSGLKSIGGANAVRMLFTPTLTRTLAKVWVRVRKQAGTTHDLTILVKQGATLLDTVTIPVASIGTSMGWVGVNLTAPLIIAAGTQYSAEMWSVAETTAPFQTWPITAGGGGSNPGPALLSASRFTDGYLQSTANSGGLWSLHNSSTDNKPQLYFEQADPAIFQPPFNVKDWDYTTTPINPAALKGMEQRLSDYTDSAAGTGYRVQTFTFSGALTVQSGAMRFVLPRAATILGVQAAAGTAPTGAAIICDVNKNGTTIFTTSGNRPSIPIAGNVSGVAVPDVTAFAAGDYMTVDVDQVGSSVAGSNLMVTVTYA